MRLSTVQGTHIPMPSDARDVCSTFISTNHRNVRCARNLLHAFNATRKCIWFVLYCIVYTKRRRIAKSRKINNNFYRLAQPSHRNQNILSFFLSLVSVKLQNFRNILFEFWLLFIHVIHIRWRTYACICIIKPLNIYKFLVKLGAFCLFFKCKFSFAIDFWIIKSLFSNDWN